MIYFDTAATGLQKPAAVFDAVAYGMAHYGNASRSAYGPSLEAARAIHAARKAVGKVFGVSAAHNVAFAATVTEALNAVIHSLIKPNGHVITTELEHNSVLRPLYKSGTRLSMVRYGEHQDSNAFRRALQAGTTAVVATYASNVTGDPLPISQIGAFCKENDLVFVLDAAQADAAVDFAAAGVDVLCFTGHKGLMGPVGVGGVCLYRDITFEPYKSGGSGSATFDTAHPSAMPYCFEAGTLNAPVIAGLHAGIEFIRRTGAEAIRAHVLALARYVYDGLVMIPGVTVYGDCSDRNARAPVVAFNIGQTDAGEAAAWLWDHHEIVCRGGFHCAPLLHRALGTDKQGAIRVSFGWFNTTDEADALLAAVRAYLQQ